MSTPRETVAEALWYAHGCDDAPEDHSYPARRALASLAQHRDGVARVLTEHRLTGAWDSTTCGCGHEYDGPTGPRDLDAHKADAVLAYLTGEAS